MNSKKLLNTKEITERLSKTFSVPNYGFITQVRSGTGNGSCRTADAMAMSLWPSRGLHLLGFEVKVSRTDWINELKNPSKAEEIAKFCHEWYLVVNSPDIVKEGELPATWGLIVPSGTGMKVVKPASFNANAVLPDYMMLAGIFRNISSHNIPKEALTSVLEHEYEKGKAHARWETEDLKRKNLELINSIKDFEDVSGVKIGRWPTENKKIGEAVNMVLEGKHLKSVETIEKMRSRAVNLVKYLHDEVEHYKTL